MVKRLKRTLFICKKANIPALEWESATYLTCWAMVCGHEERQKWAQRIVVQTKE